MKGDWDFSGYATRNDLLCSDGRTILKDAFKHQDGAEVPLVWGHRHDDPEAVIGKALLENREDGVYAYGKFNDSKNGKHCRELVMHGDVNCLSIFANKLTETAKKVSKGTIRELSLVLSGANPGAYIDFVMAHSDDGEDTLSGFEACYDERGFVVYSQDGSNIEHSDIKKEDDKVYNNELEHADNGGTSEKTVGEIIEAMSDEQKDAIAILIGSLLDDDDDDDDNNEGDDNNMKHNVFNREEEVSGQVIAHADGAAIIELAKSSSCGTLKGAIDQYCDDNALSHDAISSGFQQTANDGSLTVNALFPEYADVRPGEPELITSDQGWISKVLAKVHKSPISRVRTGQVDIRNIDALRARGYKKGKKKLQTGTFKLVRRTTDPQTIYVKSALHRDDIVDITDFDYVNYLYKIDKLQLNEELATAILLGDGREDDAEDKISPDHIRPIWTDDDLYTIKVDLDVAKAKAEIQGENTKVYFGDNYIYAEALVNVALYARESYKGSGTPDFYCTPHMLNVMLLARDRNGRRIYSSKQELASTLNVGEIITAEQFANKTRTAAGNKTKQLVGIICNLADYTIGATKGGEISHFTQFDIDFNQQKSLLETRCSGALTRCWSAIAIEEDITEDDEDDDDLGGEGNGSGGAQS